MKVNSIIAYVINETTFENLSFFSVKKAGIFLSLQIDLEKQGKKLWLSFLSALFTPILTVFPPSFPFVGSKNRKNYKSRPTFFQMKAFFEINNSLLTL